MFNAGQMLRRAQQGQAQQLELPPGYYTSSEATQAAAAARRSCLLQTPSTSVDRVEGDVPASLLKFLNSPGLIKMTELHQSSSPSSSSSPPPPYGCTAGQRSRSADMMLMQTSDCLSMHTWLSDAGVVCDPLNQHSISRSHVSHIAAYHAP